RGQAGGAFERPSTLEEEEDAERDLEIRVERRCTEIENARRFERERSACEDDDGSESGEREEELADVAIERAERRSERANARSLARLFRNDAQPDHVMEALREDEEDREAHCDLRIDRDGHERVDDASEVERALRAGCLRRDAEDDVVEG